MIAANATLGVLGGGQLGRMFSEAAQRLGYEVCVFCPEKSAPAAQVSQKHIKADYTDKPALDEFCQVVSAATYEFENIPAKSVEFIEGRIPVRPSAKTLMICQNRYHEKTFLCDHNIPTTPFHLVKTKVDLEQIRGRFKFPGVLKTTTSGYDGKGQVKVENADQLATAWQQIGNKEAIFEQWITFEREISVVVARNDLGDVCLYGPFHNEHENHILNVTTFPAAISQDATLAANQVATQVAEKLELTGVACVEMFLTDDDKVMVNEIAPRPHNSGHLTIEAHKTSQFEQQVRILAGLPLGEATPKYRAATMVNLLGDLWNTAEPDWRPCRDKESATLHLYGKANARTGRKMGHITVVGDTAKDVHRLAIQLRTQCFQND